MPQKNSLKDEILTLVKRYYEEHHKPPEFVPGKSKVHYGGRVYDHKEMVAMTNALLDFWLTLGEHAKEFEQKFSQFLGTKNSVLTNSGSSSNLIAVSTLCSPQLKDSLKPGDEAITPAVTFPTTFNPIIQNNLVPVLVDIKPDTYNIDTSLLEGALSERTRLIMLPHTMGNSSNMGEVVEFANQHGLYIIEDACDALGSKYDGKYLGTFGDISTYSFYAAHHITMGEGGCVATDSQELAAIARSIRDWGRACACPVCTVNIDSESSCPLRFQINSKNLPADYDRRYTYTNIGYNLKPLDLQAAMGIEQLKKLPLFMEKRKHNFDYLYKALSEYEDYLMLPKAEPHSEPSWFAFPISLTKKCNFSRGELTSWLEKHNIETRLLFAGNIVKQPAYGNTKYRIASTLENTENTLNSSFFIGLYPGIEKEGLEYMIGKICEFIDRVKLRQ